MFNLNQTNHQNDEQEKFKMKFKDKTVKKSLSPIDDEIKMKNRADILYPTMSDNKPKTDTNYLNKSEPGNNNKNDKQETLTGAAANIATDEIKGVKRSEPRNIEDAIQNVNPDYSPFSINPTHKTNCQACVITADARARGYDMEVSIEYSSEFKDKLSQRPNIAYIDPKTGKTPEFTNIDVKDESQCENWLNNNINQGERHLLGFNYNRKNSDNKYDGHIVIVTKNENNELKFYDPQSKTKYGKEILKNIKYTYNWSEDKTPPKILRVDDKELNKDIVERIMKPARKK